MERLKDSLFEGMEGSGQRQVLTVTQLNQDIKVILESSFPEVWVEGEVSGLSRYSTGTIFFSLKDNTSLLPCVMFYSTAASVKFEIKDGMKLVCNGSVGVYEKAGKYQLYVKKVEPKGIGSLQLALEQLKEKLQKEGLFAKERKRPVPYLPAKVGLVTSAQGAAIKDIFKVIDTRFKDIHIILSPVKVQGEGSAQDIARGIRELNAFNDTLPAKEKIEVMIVGRGGGSLEDLWAFNEEPVARAIYESSIPVISAVGHERDWTVSDLVADMRAPTPSVAAEIITPKKEELLARVSEMSCSLKNSFGATLEDLYRCKDQLTHRLGIMLCHVHEINMHRCQSAANKLAMLNPLALLPRHKQRLQELVKQIYNHMNHYVQIKEGYFLGTVEKLSGLSPLNVLSRGYSITFKEDGQSVVKDASELKKGQIIKTRLASGEVTSQVSAVSEN